jgi:hypothetical protein
MKLSVKRRATPYTFTSQSTAPEVLKAFKIKIAESNVSTTGFLNAFINAVVTGDIVMGRLPFGQMRPARGATTTYDDIWNVKLYDREGNLINKTKVATIMPEVDEV